MHKENNLVKSEKLYFTYFMEGVNFQSEPTVGLCLNIRFCIMNTIAYELNDGSCCSCLVGQTRNWL